MRMIESIELEVASIVSKYITDNPPEQARSTTQVHMDHRTVASDAERAP